MVNFKLDKEKQMIFLLRINQKLDCYHLLVS